ncbi:XdhC family protein [Ammoniphilus sp. YIM 78166]|uniref:XdhC family protein n=1 Tax=Ammoniphilus sp. YIM 78166 TaxID=1644106 RepID=UPI001F1005D6|nr:XdhC family protein [Ammoniphilus sp. YIM 78166]
MIGMSELDLIQCIIKTKQSSKKAALATVIRTKGSTPRKTGAKMIVFEDGSIVGTIGGGCGEGEVIKKAQEAIVSGACIHHQVDLTKGLFYEDGGICGGIQDIFIEPLVRESL